MRDSEITAEHGTIQGVYHSQETQKLFQCVSMRLASTCRLPEMQKSGVLLWVLVSRTGSSTGCHMFACTYEVLNSWTTTQTAYLTLTLNATLANVAVS